MSIYRDLYSDLYGDTMALTLGTDVSSHQGQIDWVAVGRTPFRFALARMSVGLSTRDAFGRANLKGIIDHLPFAGAYGVVGTAEPVEQGARLLLDEIATICDPAKILVMLDAEDFGDGSHPTIDQVDRYAATLHDELGRWPVAYVPGWWMRKYGYTAAGRGLARCPWAQSHYIDPPWSETRLQAFKPDLEFGFQRLAWLQYTSSASIAGISGNADANVFYGTHAQLGTQLLGQPEEDITLDDATKQYLDKQFAAQAGRLDRAVLFLAAGVDNAIYSNSASTPRPLPDMAKAISLKDVQAAAGEAVDPDALAALLAGRLEVAGISTDPGGIVHVTFGPATTP